MKYFIVAIVILVLCVWGMPAGLLAAAQELAEAPLVEGAAVDHSAHAHHEMAAGEAMSPVTGTPLDFFTNGGRYMPRTHCLINEAGQPDWPWIIALFTLTTTVIVGYLRIFLFWRKAYREEAPQDRNKKMMQLAYIFLFCAVCGYGFSLIMFFWPAYRLLAVFMVALNAITWGFAFSLKDFRISLSARRLQRELEEELVGRNAELERLVAERTADLEAVKEQTRQLALIAANTDNAVVMTDLEGHITWVNESFTRITGYQASEALGRKPGHLLQGPDTDPAVVAKLREHIKRREAVKARIVNYNKDGRPYWLAIEIQPMHDDEGQVTGFMAIESDITAAVEAEAKLRDAVAEARSANEAKSIFLANMSHEIRTPLTGIIGFAQMMESDPDAEAAVRQDWSRTIRSSARHLQTLLNDVLDVSKIEAGKMEVERSRVSLHELVSETASIFRVTAKEKGIDLNLICPNALPELIDTDPTRLRQVINNLVSNAIKFTSEGSVNIEVDLEEVERQGKAGRREMIRIDVVDTGPGIPADRRDSIFEPFTQADASVSRRFGGTGLGLVISRHLCRALGGDLRVESRVNFGSRFIVTLDPGDISQIPRVRADEATRLTEPLDAAQSDAQHQGSFEARILVVDDGPTNRKFIDYVLKRHGCTVELAEHGQEAVDRLKQGKQDFDLIIMDMQMPVLDGYSATSELRAMGVSCPILALTASALRGDREKCISIGCTDYLTKPVDPQKLWQMVRDTIEVNRRGGPMVSSLDLSEPGLVEMVTSYVDEVKSNLDAAARAMNEADHDALASIAHKIVGSGGTMGYHDLSNAAYALEQAARSALLEDAKVQLRALEDMLQRIRHGLEISPAPADPIG